MFKTILVATDDSANSCRAVEFAGDIASKYEARLILLHVIHPLQINKEFKRMLEVEKLTAASPRLRQIASRFPETVAENLVSLNEGVNASYRYLQVLAEQVLEHASSLVRKHGREEVETRVEDGDPAHEILQCAKRENADLILLGSRGPGDLKELLMGSVSYKVSQYAKCSCVIVK